MGLVIPELIIRDAIEEGVQFFLADTRVLDGMLEDLSAEQIASFRTALEIRPGKIRFGWPAEPVEDWSIAVLVAHTTPRQTLGQAVSDLEEGAATATGTLADPVSAEPNAALVLTAVAPIVPVRGVCRLGQEYATYALASGVVTLVDRGIKGTPALSHDAGTSVVFPEFLQSVGYPEFLHLRVDVMGTIPEFVIVLARMLKAYLTARAELFDQRGITLQQIVETDLAPRPAELGLLFVRTLQLDCWATMAVAELSPVVGGAEVTLASTLGVPLPAQPQFLTGE